LGSKEDPNVDKHFLFSPPSTTSLLIEVIVPKAAEAKENENYNSDSSPTPEVKHEVGGLSRFKSKD
jgi:hypothetical protein